MTRQNTDKEIKELIEKATNILILAHDKPDGDAIASALALYNAINENKNKSLMCADPVVPPLDYLKDADKFICAKKYAQISDINELKERNIDLIFALDSTNLDQLTILNPLKRLIKNNKTTINIDHHRENTNFGEYNIVNTKASSTAEILTVKMKKWGLKINKITAQLLLFGMVSDTSCFRTYNVTSSALRIASELIEKGANLYEIVDKMYGGYPIDTIKLWSEILKDMQIVEEASLAIATIPFKNLKKNEVGDQYYKGLPNFLRLSPDVSIAAVLYEQKPNYIKVSLRSKKGFDCVNIAKLFEGGGHFAAAGFFMKDYDLDSAKKRIIEEIKKEIKNSFKGV